MYDSVRDGLRRQSEICEHRGWICTGMEGVAHWTGRGERINGSRLNTSRHETRASQFLGADATAVSQPADPKQNTRTPAFREHARFLCGEIAPTISVVYTFSVAVGTTAVLQPSTPSKIHAPPTFRGHARFLCGEIAPTISVVCVRATSSVAVNTTALLQPSILSKKTRAPPIEEARPLPLR